MCDVTKLQHKRGFALDVADGTNIGILLVMYLYNMCVSYVALDDSFESYIKYHIRVSKIFISGTICHILKRITTKCAYIFL